MKKLLIICLLASFAITQETTSYSWEDGTGTILGSYGNLTSPGNVGTTSGISPYDGSRMLTVSESPIDGTPQAFIAWVSDLSSNQDITACFYGYDNTQSSAPSLRIWGSWSANDDINDYGGSADGNLDYTDGSGWGQVCHTFSTNQEEWDSGEALIIQARLYSSSSGPDPTVYYIDFVEITAPNSVTVIYPGGTSGGCTNTSACNYNPYATEDDGSCILPQGTISIYDIQYTSDQGEYCYESIHDQECWITSGTVMAVSPDFANLYIQDESSDSYSGIYIHNMYPTPNLGENITLTATVNEYYSLTQLLSGGSYSINSSGNAVEPTDITTGDLANGCTADGESVESMLVRISDVSVSVTSNEFGEWYVDDGSGAALIDDKIFDGEWLDPSLGQEFASIVGVVDYSYSEFSILPRTMSDIVLCPTCPVANAGDDQFVAPGTEVVTLDGSDSYDPNGTIIAYEWTQTGGMAVILADEEAEITTFTAPSINSELVFKLDVYDNDYNIATDEVTITVSSGESIQDIQCPNDLVQGTYCYETSMDGDEISTYGVVTHVVPESNDGSAGNFFLQEPGADICGGIYIRDFDIIPSIGDELTLSGTVSEYYSFTQITDVTASSISSTDNSTNPMSISTNDLGIVCSEDGEYLEGMLVKVSNITIENIDEFGNVQINDGSGSTLMDDYYFNGQWPNISVGNDIDCITGVVGYSYSEFKIYPRDLNDFGTGEECDGGDEVCMDDDAAVAPFDCTSAIAQFGCEENWGGPTIGELCPESCGLCDDDDCDVEMGDLDNNGAYNVLDIVQLANCILAEDCSNLDTGCAADLNDDGAYNVLDIVALVNCILANNCNGRVDDATQGRLILKDNVVSIDADGFIGGVQMTLQHENNFQIELTDRALLAEYLTQGNETRLLIITPETDELFNYNGNFEIAEIIVANSHNNVSMDIPIAEGFILNQAYPNPFNPVTSIEFILIETGSVSVQIYNLQGQLISTLLSGNQIADIYILTWDASNSPSGIYFVKAECEGFVTSRKLMLIK